MNQTAELIEKALALPNFDVAKAHKKMLFAGRTANRPSIRPGKARVSAVLCLLFWDGAATRVLLTKRPDTMREHSGQISFPGGRREGDEALVHTALREANEEVGLNEADVTILGPLARIYIPPSDFYVHPFVGWVGFRPKLIPNPSEVAQILEPTLDHLLDPATVKTQKRKFKLSPVPIPIPYFDVDGHVVWGATAFILSEFIARWRVVNSANQLTR